MAIKPSNKKFDANGIPWGATRDAVPNTNKILKILLPIIFPIAISFFPFKEALTDVTNSGKEVPKKKIINPIIQSLKQNNKDIKIKKEEKMMSIKENIKQEIIK